MKTVDTSHPALREAVQWAMTHNVHDIGQFEDYDGFPLRWQFIYALNAVQHPDYHLRNHILNQHLRSTKAGYRVEDLLADDVPQEWVSEIIGFDWNEYHWAAGNRWTWAHDHRQAWRLIKSTELPDRYAVLYLPHNSVRFASSDHVQEFNRWFNDNGDLFAHDPSAPTVELLLPENLSAPIQDAKEVFLEYGEEEFIIVLDNRNCWFGSHGSSGLKLEPGIDLIAGWGRGEGL